MTTINWGTDSLSFAGAQRVYTRQRWADEWTLQGNLWCEEASWSLLPAMPSASFTLRYGRVLAHGSSSWSTQAKLAIGGYYIKVEFDCEDGTISWVGFIDQLADEQGGITSSIAYGTQRFVALGMAQLLAYEYVTRSRWFDEPNAVARWSGSAITFNQDGKPNRSNDDTPADSSVPIFAPSAPKNWNGLPWSTPKFWSSRDIASYLVEHAAPIDASGDKLVPFRIDGLSSIPNWDRPTIETEGKSVLSILEELVNASRLLQISQGIDEDTPDVVVLKVHSLSASALSLPGSNTHPANTDTVSFVTVGAHDTNVVVQASVTSLAHQVVVKGAKRETCFTSAIEVNGSNTSTAFIAGWNSTEQSIYNDAAFSESGYDTASTQEQKHLNQIVRSRHKLNDVYKTLVLNPEFTFEMIDSAGDAFVFVDSEDNQYYPFWNAINILPQLPLKEGIQYEEADVSTDEHEATVEYRPIYVLFKRPGSSPSQYLQAEKMADGVDPKFSVSVGLSKDNQGITLDVSGSHQHAIAFGDFEPLDADTDELGEWTYDDALATISVSDDRFVEYAFPNIEDVPATIDAVRKKVFYAGDSYKLVRVLPGTNVDVDNAGATQDIHESNIEAGGAGTLTLVDDTAKLESIGQIAAAWYLVPRQILRLTSARPTAAAFVGQIATTLNTGTGHAATLNTVVSEIRLQTPQSDRLAPVNFSITTAMGELDPLQFVPPAPAEKVAKV
jgi:hypothetical protein